MPEKKKIALDSSSVHDIHLNYSEQLTIFLQTFYRLFCSKTEDMLTNDATKMTLVMFTASLLVSRHYNTDAALFFKYCCPQKRSHMFSIKPFSTKNIPQVSLGSANAKRN